MDLGQASSYFADTPIDGWNGTGWNVGVGYITLLPYDRFISEREFGLKRRMVLTKVGDTFFDDYAVVRVGAEVYLVGSRNMDVQGDIYSHTHMIHRAAKQLDILEFTKTASASGLAREVTRTVASQVWGDIERATVTNSKEFETIKFSQITVALPRDAVIDTDNEIFDGESYYDVQEVYPSAGFVYCRVLKKRSA